MDVSITPWGSEASRIASLLFYAACLFSSLKINEHALIQLEEKKRDVWSPNGVLTKEAKTWNKKEWDRDPNLMQSSAMFYETRLSQSYPWSFPITFKG